MSVATAVRTKVFISYSHKDANFLVELQEQLGTLQRRGLLNVWADTQIKPGGLWREEIDEALASAKVAILLVSPTFLNSTFITEVELPHLLKAVKEEGVKILPIIVRHCLYDETELQPYQAFNSPQRPLSDVKKNQREKVWASLGKAIKEALAEPPPQPLPSSKPPEPAKPAEPIWHVPPYTPFFTGRERELESLRNTFMARAGLVTQALTGLGGMGKTQTALAYAHRYRQEYHTVFWAQAENREVLFGDMTRFASLLQLPARDISEQQVIVGAVTRWLEANTNWLLILDNVNDLALVREVLPRQGSGHVLLTTQTRALAGVAQDAHLNELLPEDAQLLLLRRANLLTQDAPLAEAS
ncbi:MAG TPA: TIR domain-containing protein, partial [Ktedonobacterales bacterium]|nr:TIR domain-containing protein [Ktedonobacterales bacterium]